nr:hypothetical protein B0A51_09269 [Rachicladosporium sp. CCFEE 5018]
MKWATLLTVFFSLSVSLVNGKKHKSTSTCVYHMPTAVPPHPKAYCQYRKMSDDKSYVRNVTEIPDKADGKYGWVVTGNDRWSHVPWYIDDEDKARNPEVPVIHLLKALETCGKISGYHVNRIVEYYGFVADNKTGILHLNSYGQPLTLYNDTMFRASFFTPHAQKHSGQMKHCISDVLGDMMHQGMSSAECGDGCPSDHRISKCWKLDDKGNMALKGMDDKNYVLGKMSSTDGCNTGPQKCVDCIMARLKDPLWQQQEALQCHAGHGITFEQMQEHNRIYETTQLPDPCPGATGYKPTDAASPDNGVWIDPPSGPRKTKPSGGVVQTTMIA